MSVQSVRLEICKECPLYKDVYGGQCNPRLWLNPKTGEVSTTSKEGFYKGCGCALQFKTANPDNVCPALKW